MYAYSTSATPSVDPNNTAPLEQALTTVPKGDVAGAEIPGVPRPAASVRSYYQSNPTVATAVYTRYAAVDDVRPGVQAALESAGWGVVGDATPSVLATSPRTWQAVYSDGHAVLQVEMFTHGDVTATVYVLQRTQAGQ